MKILFVNTNIGYGGASKMIAAVSHALAEEHSVEILTFRAENIKQDIDERVKLVHEKLYSHKIKPIELIGQILKLRQYIKRNNIDLVIAFLHPAHYMAVLATNGTNAKVLLSERGDPVTRMKNGKWFVHLIEKIIHQADAYVFQSDGALKAYPQKCQKKGRIIVNAIPYMQYPTYSPSEQKYILCAARIELVQKRQDVLVEAFSLFLTTHKDYRLCLAGDGPDMDQLMQKINDLEIQEYVDMVGAREDVLQLMAKSSFFVLPSDYEGLPNALLEAIAIGVPCISTDCSPGGARMIIKDGANGFIVPCNDPVAMAEKMTLLADNETLRKLFSENCKSAVVQFDQKIIDDQWLRFVNEIVK